jgi:hypothetical protein
VLAEPHAQRAQQDVVFDGGQSQDRSEDSLGDHGGGVRRAGEQDGDRDLPVPDQLVAAVYASRAWRSAAGVWSRLG